MIDLKDRRVLDDGTVICDQRALMEMIYSGLPISGTFCSDQQDEREWEAARLACDGNDPGPLHADAPAMEGISWRSHWMTPEPWASLDLRAWCRDRCSSEPELARVELEINEFENRNMIGAIRHLAFCADTWRGNGVFWGVGRGSSVCSFVLYLIGINRINPMEHDLELGEWLK